MVQPAYHMAEGAAGGENKKVARRLVVINVVVSTARRHDGATSVPSLAFANCNKD
jgi:hypothetical protein